MLKPTRFSIDLTAPYGTVFGQGGKHFARCSGLLRPYSGHGITGPAHIVYYSRDFLSRAGNFSILAVICLAQSPCTTRGVVASLSMFCYNLIAYFYTFLPHYHAPVAQRIEQSPPKRSMMVRVRPGVFMRRPELQCAHWIDVDNPGTGNRDIT